LPRILLLFVDGVGLGDDDEATNPFLRARLPHLTGLLGGRTPLRDAVPFHAEHGSLVAVDATLGHEWTPQSGTGQAALLTGANAVTMHGRHFGPWVPARLQRLVREESVLASARASGHTVAFANAYPEEVLQLAAATATREARRRAGAPAAVLPADAPPRDDDSSPEALSVDAAASAAARRRDRRMRRAPTYLRAGPPLAALGAGVLNRHTAALERGEAVASEITNDGWHHTLGRTSVPLIPAEQAGRNLAGIAAGHHLTLFAHYATDYAGHRRDMGGAVQALERLDSFLGGVLEGLPRDVLLVMVSDHGNIEDTTAGHTRNPALGLVAGQGHALLSRRMQSLVDVAPMILDVLAL
jgi:2,3-bisphosphoglycerate-independent phosphoglycerate mutase